MLVWNTRAVLACMHSCLCMRYHHLLLCTSTCYSGVHDIVVGTVQCAYVGMEHTCSTSMYAFVYLHEVSLLSLLHTNHHHMMTPMFYSCLHDIIVGIVQTAVCICWHGSHVQYWHVCIHIFAYDVPVIKGMLRPCFLLALCWPPSRYALGLPML